MQITRVFSVKNNNFVKNEQFVPSENKRLIFKNDADSFVSFGKVKNYNTDDVFERQEIIDNIQNYKRLGNVQDGEIFLLPDNKHLLKMFDTKFSKKYVENLLTNEVNKINSIVKKRPGIMKQMGISIAEYRWAAYDTEKKKAFVCYQKPSGNPISGKELADPQIAKMYFDILDWAEEVGFPLFELSFNKDLLPRNKNLAPVRFNFVTNLANESDDKVAFDGKVKPIDNMGMVNINVPYEQWDRTPVFNPEKNPRRLYTALETFDNERDMRGFVKVHTESEIAKLARRNGLTQISLAKNSFRDKIRREIADAIDSSDAIDVIASDPSFKGFDHDFDERTDNIINTYRIEHLRRSKKYTGFSQEYLNGIKIKDVKRSASLADIKSPKLLISEEENNENSCDY